MPETPTKAGNELSVSVFTMESKWMDRVIGSRSSEVRIAVSK